tara:strand:- start:3117 stop:3308 length:192 start_codon:yes stop_codon:yes gene_type:complete
MECFEQDDFLLEDKLKEAKFAIDDIIDSVYADTDNKMELIKDLEKVQENLEKQIEKEQSGEFN